MELDHVFLRKLQLIQYEILKDIDRICKANGLRYYLYGGTLLGAIRHRGFIPWDDDLDISMYRSDYLRLQGILQSEYKDKYFVQNVYTDKKYPRIIAKVRLRGTKLVEEPLQKVACDHGIYVDVFPMDHVVRNNGIGMTIRAKILRLCLAYKTMRAGVNNGQRVLLKKTLRFITFLVPAVWVNWVIEYVCSKDNKKSCKYTSIFLSGLGWKRQTHPNETFGEGRLIPFEDGLYPAPIKAEEYLSRAYGNYMQPPPEYKRYDKHQIVELDFGPYMDMLNEKYNA